jgi:Raf kinase inhibitor-like YbhB/YbcL family protein
MWSGRAALAALALALAPAFLACGDDGRALREPRPDQTTTSTEAASAAVDDTAADPSVEPGSAGDALPVIPDELTLISPAFGDDEAVPERYTCRGAAVSPPLRWDTVPPETVELAVVVRDLDADGFLHWVIAGLSPDLGGLAEDTVPDGAVEATNDFGRPGWGGPCPPSGTHRYEIRIYALADSSGVEADQPGVDAVAAIEALPALRSAVLNVTAAAD